MPYYKEITRVLTPTFKLESFRANQLKAINVTMSGQDVFVLMPTGGGKSLCYQLPAVCKSGSTHRLMVVISPLIALMNDQVTSRNNSMAHCKAVFVGSKKKEVLQRGHNGLPGHGKGIGIGQKAVDQLFEELVAMDVFREQPIANSAGWSNNYLQVSLRAWTWV